MTNIKIFENDEFGQARTIMIDGELWFVGKDVAESLGYEKARNGLEKHVDSEDASKWGVPTPRGIQTMTIINKVFMICRYPLMNL